MRNALKVATMMVIGAGVLGLGLIGGGADDSQAMTVKVDAPSQTSRVADVMPGTGGIQTWTRLLELDGRGEAEWPAQTLFVPSDDAFAALPAEELAALLAPDQPDRRRAFMARAATETRLAPQELAGRRLAVTTLDGRLLVIDGTGGELLVGDAEAIDVRQLPDGRTVFVLDHALTR